MPTLEIPKTGQRRSQPLSSTFDREKRTVEAVLATSGWIDGPLGPERLVMTDAAVDLSAAAPSMPLHDNHGPGLMGTTGERIGVIERVRVSNGKLKGTLRLSRNATGEAALTDIEDGIITHVSVGYRILGTRPSARGLLITQWAPHEVSTPSVVADRAAVIQRAKTMTDANTDDHTDDHTDDDLAIEKTPAYLAGMRAGQERMSVITAAYAPFPAAGELRTRALAEGWDIEKARAELLAYLGQGASPTPRGPDIVAGEDDMAKFTGAASDAICTRARIITGDAAIKVQQENEYFGYSLRELAREYIRRTGDRIRGDARMIVGQALTRAGIISHSTSDFANLLVDAANKALQLGYMEAGETYEAWTRAGSLPDFKTGHRPKLSTFSDLEEVPEAAEIGYGTFSDFRETIALVAYAKLFSITRKSIIDDDLGAFTEAPRAMARAAKRLIGDKVYGIFSENGNMSDGTALFVAGHSNYIAGGSGAAPSVTTLNAAYASMATQTDPGGATLNITPAFIIAPHALRGTIDALLGSSLDPAEGSSTAFQAMNIWRGRLTPVYDARIDGDDAAKWYLAAAPAAIDTIEVAYLNGVQTPRLEREEGFTVDGVTLKVGHDFGVSPLDWRGLYHNDGN